MKVRVDGGVKLWQSTVRLADCPCCDSDPFRGLPFGDPWPTAATPVIPFERRSIKAFNG